VDTWGVSLFGGRVMFRKLSLGFVVSLGLVLLAGTAGPEAAQGQPKGDCCKQSLACCKGDRACCKAGDQKPGCCAKGQKCCADNRECCDKAPSCCQKGNKCCDEGDRACCGKKAA
jgi:hypothetical protein